MSHFPPFLLSFLLLFSLFTFSSGSNFTVSSPISSSLSPASIHYTAFISQWLSIPGSSLIIIYSLKHWKSIGASSASPSLRFPLYISLSDLIFTASHFVDHAFILNNQRFPSHGACQFFGFILESFSLAAVLNVTNAAIFALVYCFSLHSLDYGRFDWRLWSITFGIPIFFSFFALGFDYFGEAGGAYCWVKDVEPDANLIFITIPFTFLLFLNVGILLAILFKIRSHQSNRLRNSMIKRSILFVFAYLIQFSPLVSYSLQTRESSSIPYSTVLLVVATINLGGLLNLIVYGSQILRLGGENSVLPNEKTQSDFTFTRPDSDLMMETHGKQVNYIIQTQISPLASSGQHRIAFQN